MVPDIPDVNTYLPKLDPLEKKELEAGFVFWKTLEQRKGVTRAARKTTGKWEKSWKSSGKGCIHFSAFDIFKIKLVVKYVIFKHNLF